MLVKLDTGFNIEVDFSVTPFYRRFVAWLIDLSIMGAYWWLGFRLLSYIFTSSWSNADWAFVLFSLPVLFYHLILELMWNGQSIGKKTMGIRVITLEGGQPTASQYLIRWVFRLADFPLWIPSAILGGGLPWWSTLFLFAGIGTFILSPKSQRIGDLVAGTIVIDTRTHTSWRDTVFTELETDYQPRFKEVMLLTDKDINTLKGIIESVKKKNNFDLAMRVAERIKTRLKIQSDQDALDFLETLLKDYNYYSVR
jgi:uncharacterized RDD family membrane protein YckC